MEGLWKKRLKLRHEINIMQSKKREWGHEELGTHKPTEMDAARTEKYGVS